MASHFYTRSKPTTQPTTTRNRLRRILLETLERRELLAADSAGVIFAPGTAQSYMDEMIGKFLRGSVTEASGEAGAFNVGGQRWSNPTGGVSANQGDPTTVSWSIVPDGTAITGLDGAPNTSSNLIAFMDNIYGGGSGPVEQRPWFRLFKASYDRWSELTGVTFVYEANDDSSLVGGSNRGVTGVRGDVRIGGSAIDGNYNTLAYNYYPNSGGNDGLDGDMVIDTNDVYYFNSADSVLGENRSLSNVLMHEAGHGIGLGHVIPINGTKLMEPNASNAFLGPQHDDILAAQKLYGDRAENNDSQASAFPLGTLANGLTSVQGNSIDRNGDDDWYQFTLPSAGKITLSLAPVGSQFDVGPDGGTASSINTQQNLDLSLELVASDGTVLALVNAAALGETESLTEFDIAAGGDYFVRVLGSGSAADDPQLYNLGIRLKGLAAGYVGSQPRLLSIAPNSGEIFSFNNTTTLLEAPTELTFRFDGASDIDESTLAGGIQVIRSGGDGVFGNGNDIVVSPGHLGLGDNNRIAVMRFASTLVDDLYRVEVLGEDDLANNRTAVSNALGVPIQTRAIDSTPLDTTRDSIDFNLELGALVTAVVPQPVDRLANGTLSPQRDKIRVYFNNDDLYGSAITTGTITPNPTVVDPAFYQLILSQDTVQPGDDAVFLPTSISYDPATDMAELTFAMPIDQLAGAGTYRLRVGSNDAVVSESNPVNITQLNPLDPASNIDAAYSLGSFGGAFSTLINQSIDTQSILALPLDFPGSNYDPGHRDIQDETHLNGGGDASPQIAKVAYNFALNRPYGLDASGRPVETSITSDQIQRVREIFEFYSTEFGIDFVETQSAGLSIVVGDLFPLGGEQSAPGGIIGLAGGSLAIMDGAETWDNSFGGRSGIPGAQSFFGTAMHEIGHLLGLGHTYDQPPGTIMGDTGDLADPNPGLGTAGTEWAFPGEVDIVHGQYMYRPDNRDVDTYSFTIPTGQTGTLSAETIAERLPNSSDLDSYLTLIKRTADGFEVLASNNDNTSSDSFLSAKLDAGEYFISVTGKGNEDFNPAISNTGSGAVSQGAYQLKLDFAPDVASIVDASGTALDGDGDGLSGGNFNFWFRTAAPVGVAAAGEAKTVYVDKSYVGPQTGSATQPMNNLDLQNSAKWPAGFLKPGDVVRVVGSGGADRDLNTLTDNPAYEIGRGGVGNAILSDGLTLQVPQGVSMQVDAGAIFKLQGSRISVGSLSASIDQSLSSLQILGTPAQSVQFTSFKDQSQGIDTNPINTTPVQGDWGGIDFHGDVDRIEGRGDYERQGIFLNYVAHADLRYGGGQITVSTPSPTVSPINMSESRPTLLYNTIRLSSDAAMAADPNTFEETRFTHPRYQLAEVFRPDYVRVGPDIRGNTLVENSVNGLFVRTSTAAGAALTTMEVAARFDDTDITHVLGENLVISGTPGGPVLETVAPDVSLVQVTAATGGTLTAGQRVRYVVTFVDKFGAEGLPSAPTADYTLTGNAVSLNRLPQATGDFVARRLWRRIDTGDYILVAELDGDTRTFTDSGQDLAAILKSPSATTLQRARLDARLQIDPGVVIKSTRSRIEAGIGAQLIAEGTAERPVIFTSRADDTYGAGGTFDTNNDQAGSAPAAGDWGGLIARHLSSISIDNALVTYGGGITSVSGAFAGFNAIEIHQADARVANTRLEMNASGLGGDSGASRDGHGPNEASVIFVVGSQPVLVNNTIRNNAAGSQTAAISINANAMNTNSSVDNGRQTGPSDRVTIGNGNAGPLIDGNLLAGNGLNGLRIRGETLTTETVWDDTDIVHILQSEIVVPDFHTFGGLRLQSRSDESLVVKLSGAGAGFTALGRPLDITDRIGGSIHIIGAPGFPVVLTSLSDDSVGAGFDPVGRALLDTNSDGFSEGSPGDWRSIKFEPYANDRNVDIAVELETDQIQETGTNDVVGVAQSLGGLAASLSDGDENLRLGFSLDGAIAAPQDIDVYSFSGVAGNPVWIDVDHTSGSLDVVVELVDASGTILAQSDNSLLESAGTETRYVSSNASKITPDQVLSLDSDPFATANSFIAGTDQDLYSVNPLDAGMRIVLPGAVGATNTYFVRVRSSNVKTGDSKASLQDPSRDRDGLTQGAYRLQIRMQQTDEAPGSTVRYADIRYASNGIEALGQPSSSPLLGQLASTSGGLDLGNIINSDRGSVSVAGQLTSATGVNLYTFTVQRGSTQVIDPADGSAHISTIFDIDYADGFGRPDTSLWVFDSTGALVLVGTDSNIADDRAAPLNGSDVDDLTRGSSGARDPFIGASELPAGQYTVAVTNNSRMATVLDQFQIANATNPLVRLEPVNSVNRISVDRFEGGNLFETANPPVQVTFSNVSNNRHYSQAIGWTLADITSYVVRDQGNGSQLSFANAMSGAREAEISNFIRVNDAAMSPDGRLVGYQLQQSGRINDATSGNFHLINSIGAPGGANTPNNASTQQGNTGIQTFTTQPTSATAFAIQQRDPDGFGGGVGPEGDGILIEALTFYTNDNNALKMYGVGSRGNGQTSFALPTFDGNNNVNGISTVRSYNATNIVYRLDPDSGAAINPANTNDRTGNGRTNGAGTQKVEFGRFLSGTEENDYTDGTVTGLAEIDGVLYAVSDMGELFRAPLGGNGNSGFSRDLTFNDATKTYYGTLPELVIEDNGAPVRFTGLTSGPRNLEEGRFADTLFGITEDGTIYAFNTAGELQPVFPGFSYKTHSQSRSLGTNVTSIDFSPLDVNLWHLTERRDNEAGHGRTVPFDSSQESDELGDRALYFGFEANSVATRQAGDWSGVYDVAAYQGTYDLPGGAHGAILSNPIDLRGYSADDLPMLYFNYLLETSDTNSDRDDGDNRMQDAFRVYGAGEDGDWVLLATNNTPRDNGLDRNLHSTGFEDELDNVQISPNHDTFANLDPFGDYQQTQEVFDGQGWRQARTSLAALAGQENVRLRFEFSTGASFRTGDALTGGIEITSVAGSKITDGQFFRVAPQDGVSPHTGAQTLEFDLGLVLNLPGGAGLTSDVSKIDFNGTEVVFSTTDGSGNNIFYDVTDTPAEIAQHLTLRLPGILGISPNDIRIAAQAANVLNIAGLAEGTYSTLGFGGNVIQGLPGVNPGNVAIPVNQAMTITQVRDSIRTTLAETFNDPNNSNTFTTSELDAWPVHDDIITLYKYDVVNLDPITEVPTSSLGVTLSRMGDEYGVQSSSGFGSNGINRLDERAQDNAYEGIYLDDIIVGFAERGEMVFDAGSNTSFSANQQYAETLYDILQVEEGRYQLVVRAAADYGTTDEVTGDLVLFGPFGRSYDTNDRLSQGTGILVSPQAAGNIADGVTFTLSEGGAPVTFEFDVTTGGNGIEAGVTPGNVAVSITTDATNQEIATAIRDAINSSTTQLRFSLTASLSGEMSYGGFGDAAPSGSTLIILHGPASGGVDGTFTFGSETFLQPVMWGTETGFGEDHGDRQRKSPQGQILLVGNTITDSSNFGIVTSAGNRDQSGIGEAVANRPYPGAPLNLPTPNTSRLAPGIVIANNILANNEAGGIRVVGDTAGGSSAPVQIARIINNTIYGTGSGDGIHIESGASPTILNNIIANNATGISAPAGSSSVIGANVYQSNVTHTQNVGLGSFAEVLAPTTPLFVDTTNRRFYLAPGSRAIDSSLEALQERAALAQVKNSISVAPSPMLAPDLDVTGQRRVDDPTVNSPAGLGGNVFKDRGAVDRSDFIGLEAVILQPQDNDAFSVDTDRASTYIQLTEGLLEYFSILLKDTNGTGPDPSTVVSPAFVLKENGTTLIEGVDYIFGYNANSRTVRLTPVAGIWRTDSVYEINVINQDSFTLNVQDGATTNDGDSFSIAHAGGVQVFEMDSDGSVASGAIAVTFSEDSSNYDNTLQLLTKIRQANLGVFAYIQGANSVTVSGAQALISDGSSVSVDGIDGVRDLAGNELFANRSNSLTQFTIIMPEVELDFGDARFATDPLGVSYPTVSKDQNGRRTIDAPRHTLLPLDVNILALGRYVDGEVDGQPNPSATGDDTGSLVISTTIGGATLTSVGAASVVAQAATAAIDGQLFTITDAGRQTVTFEFDTSADPGTVADGHLRIPVLETATADEVASAVSDAVLFAVMEGQLFGLTPVADNARVSLGGGRGVEFDFTAAPALMRTQLNQFDLTLPATGFADGQTLTIVDSLGRSSIFELEHTLDGHVSNGVQAGNIAVNVDVVSSSSEQIATAFSERINQEVLRRRISMGSVITSGSALQFSGDDEDGVHFTSVFNANLAAVPVIVTATGAGILDVWFDWNQDGDFSDPGERIATDVPVRAGENTLMVTTPQGAALGVTTTRFRLSTGGNLSLGGVAVGGEVEDHLITVVTGSPPVAVNDSYTVLEDDVLVVGATGILANDTDVDTPVDELRVQDQNPATPEIDPVENVSHGTLQLNRDGSFTYTPNADFNGIDTFVYNATDTRLQSSAPATVTITVAAVNDAPEFTIALPATSVEDQGMVQIDGFLTNLMPGTATATDEATQNLTINVQAADPSAFAVLPTIGLDGTLRFQTAVDANSDHSNLEVWVTVEDDGADLPPPNQNSSQTKTFTIQTGAINDAPQFTLAQLEVTVPEDAEQFTNTPNTTIAGFASDLLSGPTSATDEIGQQLSFEIVSVSAPELFAVQPSLNATGGDLTFTTAANRNGKSLVVTRLLDDGTSAPLPNQNASGLRTFTINIEPVNDAPSFTLDTVSVAEDAGVITRTGFAQNIRTGPAGTTDEERQTLTFDVVAIDPTSFLVQPSLSADGTLVFQTAQDTNRLNSDFRVRVSLRDSGLGDPPPNTNISAEQTFTIDVTPVNDSPSVGEYSTSGVEDTMLTIQSTDLLAGAIAGPTFDELGQALRVTQVATSSVAGGRVTPVFGDAADPTKVTSIQYQPPLNLVGSDSLLFVVTDDGSPEHSGTGTVVINLTSVNDAPQFTRGTNVTVPEDSGAVTFEGWATNILPGPPSATDELDQQTVSFLTSADKPELFAVQPSVDGNGVLSFRTAIDAIGTAIVRVRAQDDGASTAPDINQSPEQTFTVTITPVNDAPVFTAGPNITVNEDSSQFTGAWANNIAAAGGLLSVPPTATDEMGQGLEFIVTVDRPELFSVQPTLDSTGALSFTPQANAFGQAVATVVLKDLGPANANDSNQSTPYALTISITPQNDAPVAVGDSYSTTEDAILSVDAASGLLLNDTDFDIPADTLSVVAGTLTSESGADVVLNADGSFSYDATAIESFQQLQAGQSIFDRFVYKVQDAEGALSNDATVTIEINGVDDAPVANDDQFSIGVGQALNLQVLLNDTDIDSTIDRQTIEITASPAFGTVESLAVGVVRYIPDPGFRGSDTFKYTVRDSAGNVSNEATVQITVNSAPVAANDSGLTYKNQALTINVLNNDSDPDGTIDPATVQIEQQPTQGSAVVQADGTVLFTPATDFTGTATFSYSFQDNVGTPSNVATVSIQVLNSKWQNPSENLDVNADGFVAPIDALLIINYLNAGRESYLPDTDVVPPPYLDVNGDEFVAPVDVLLIINFLNNQSLGGGAEGEGEMVTTEHVMMVTPEQIIATVGPQIVREIQEAMDVARLSVLDDENLSGELLSGGAQSSTSATAANSLLEPLGMDDDMLDVADDLEETADEFAVDWYFDDLGPKYPK
ncbi:DVUA0089 family protein [Aureliella helgolandensis]|uniref:Matrixin n=1 Tax=Aureliella helgolandensis TaxID=2527968 RepID=A0A518G1J1_9BACT|nr:DVUA0089 family protein [Aureliella helgolandensis]QDV22465.1 Matrixin [Aureliella helgolandensis]